MKYLNLFAASISFGLCILCAVNGSAGGAAINGGIALFNFGMFLNNNKN